MGNKKYDNTGFEVSIQVYLCGGRASLVDQEDQEIDQRVKFSTFCRFFNMVDDISEARDISGRSEGPTANLTESKTDENLW